MLPSRDATIRLNRRQKEYYEHQHEMLARHPETKYTGSRLTDVWWRLRDRLANADAAIGIHDDIIALHKRWLGDLTDRSVLDLGCFSGNPLSLWIAGRARRYLGIDLSEKAIAELNTKLADLGRADVEARCVDILANDFADATFDVIYAKSVLHHFENVDEMCQELDRILAPGGMIISDDPLQTEWLNRLARAIYRPFQLDRAWEWPFSKRTLDILERHFDVVDIQGYRGLSRLAYPLIALPFLADIGYGVGRWGWRRDQQSARFRHRGLYRCWNVTMRMQKLPEA